MFSPDVRSESNSGGLSVREYVAIGLCSLFLAIVYVASIIFYMHRRAKKEKKTNLRKRGDAHITLGEEGDDLYFRNEKLYKSFEKFLLKIKFYQRFRNHKK